MLTHVNIALALDLLKKMGEMWKTRIGADCCGKQRGKSKALKQTR